LKDKKSENLSEKDVWYGELNRDNEFGTNSVMTTDAIPLERVRSAVRKLKEFCQTEIDEIGKDIENPEDFHVGWMLASSKILDEVDRLFGGLEE